jgi:hypothetical protein
MPAMVVEVPALTYMEWARISESVGVLPSTSIHLHNNVLFREVEHRT